MPTIKQVREWITSCYGLITERGAGGHFVAVVAIRNGHEIGFGSTADNAICDLRRRLGGDENSYPDLPMQRWEWEMRAIPF